MDRDKIDRLNALLTAVEGSSEERRRFLDAPVQTIGSALELNLPIDDNSLNPANALLLGVLKNENALRNLNEVAASHADGSLSLSEARFRTAKILINEIPELHDPVLNAIQEAREAARSPKMTNQEIKDAIDKPIVIDPSNPKEFGPSIANIIVAVDIALAVTEFVALHSEYVANGRFREGAGETRRMANIVLTDIGQKINFRQDGQNRGDL